MKNKIICCIILAILLFSSYTTIVYAKNNDNEKIAIIEEENYISSEEKLIEFEKNIKNVIHNQSYTNFFKGWKVCGPAYVESEGKGLFLEKFRLKLALNAASPTFFRIMRWWNFCKYYNFKAETTIEPLVGKPIHLKGPHSVIAGTLIYPGGALGGIIGSILPKLEDRFDFINKSFGEPVWDWGLWVYGIGESPLEDQPFLNFLYENVRLIKILYLFRLPLTVLYVIMPIGIPLYGLYQTLDFSGISPFILYKE